MARSDLEPHTDHILMDEKSREWVFRTFHNLKTCVLVISPSKADGNEWSIKRSTSFSRHKLSNKPRSVVRDLFDDAKMFKHLYAYTGIVWTFEKEDISTDTVNVGVCIRFRAGDDTLMMFTEDARLLWDMIESMKNKQ